MDFDVNTAGLERYARSLREAIRLFPRAQANLLNNMAFGVRTIALEWGIPRVMTVRNPTFLSSCLRVDKAHPGATGRMVATLGMSKRDRFGGLLEQEIGGEMQRQPAMLAARKGDFKKTLPSAARFKGDFISPEDIDVAHDTGSWAQRIVVMISQLERQNYKRPFIMHGSPQIGSGLLIMGKHIKGIEKRQYKRRINRLGEVQTIRMAGLGGLMRSSARTLTRQLVTLRTFGKGQTTVKRKPWLRPSIDHYLSTHNRQIEWERALRFANALQGNKGK